MLADKNDSGFTLIEISIVLVIIGLIVGGILTGRDLIRTSELNSIIGQQSKYSVAVNTFRSKYGCLPGDCANATQFFGIAGGSAADNYTDSCYDNANENSTTTCNGEGNGYIGGGSLYWTFMNTEGPQAWQHLALAGLIEGKYNPILSPTGEVWEITGLNRPRSKAQPNAGFSLYFLCITAGWGNIYYQNGKCAHTFFYGTDDPGNNSNWEGMGFWPVLSPADAKRIDAKIDNSLPATGTVTSVRPDGSFRVDYSLACTTTTVVSTAQYNTTLQEIACPLMFTAEGF